MHQAAHRKVRQPQPIELLPDQIWRLAAKHYPCTPQVVGDNYLGRLTTTMLAG
jgi:hypothetical protein